MYVDFTSEKPSITDATSGEVKEVVVFVAILGASQLTYVEPVMSQGKEDFINACRHAVEYFGGSPDAIGPDNLRSAVTKSSKYEPEINRSFEDFASHYSMSVLPALAYRPRDKALVEGAVKIVYRKIFAHLRDEIFLALDDLHAAVHRELEAHNRTPLKDRTYSRRELFEEIERDTLAPLPRIRYELRSELRATVMKNGHVSLSTDKHYNSVSHTLIGLLLFTQTSVDIFLGVSSTPLDNECLCYREGWVGPASRFGRPTGIGHPLWQSTRSHGDPQGRPVLHLTADCYARSPCEHDTPERAAGECVAGGAGGGGG